MRRRKPGESLQDLFLDVTRLVTLAHPGARSSLGDVLATDAFIDSLDNEDLEVRVRDRGPTDLDAAFRIAVQLESNRRRAHTPEPVKEVHKEVYRERERRPPFRNSHAFSKKRDNENEAMESMERRLRQIEAAPAMPFPPSNPPSELKTIRDDCQRLREELDKLRNSDADKDKELYKLKQKYEEVENKIKDPPPRVLPPFTPSQPTAGPARLGNDRPIVCFNCQQPGHWSMNCPEPRRDNRQGERRPYVAPPRNPPNTFTRRNDIPTCRFCNKPGHTIDVCRHRMAEEEAEKRKYQARASGVFRPARVHAKNERDSDRKTYLEMKIRGVRHGFLLDTGCEVSVIPHRFVRNFKLLPSDFRIYAANGIEIPVLGRVLVPLSLNGITIPTMVEVSAHISEAMLGIDWLDQNKAQWDFNAGTITLDGNTFDLRRRPEGDKRVCRIFAQRNIDVPAYSEAIVPGSITYPSRDVVDREWAIEPNTLRSGLQIARVLLPSRMSDVPVRVLNTSDHPITIQADEELSECSAVRVGTDKSTSDSSSLEHLEELIEGVDEVVTVGERQELRDLLYEYKDIFSTSEFDLGKTDIVKHQIDTGDSRPIKQALRRHPISQLPAIDEHVELMLQQGVIEPSTSPWVCNVVIVTKRDGAIRFCLDYRQLNAITRKDSYPLPRIEACLDALGGANYFSAFDLRSGYHQVEMDEPDKDKTSFVTRQGTFRFRVMPFGLCNAPGTFQRIMDIVMAGLNFQVLLVYLDDIILFSRTTAEHLERLRLLFGKLREANLKLKPSKCKLIKTEVEFLGHVVSGKGIATDPSKISTVQDWPTPQNLTEVRSFLGLCGYYRRFVKDFSVIAAPLHALTGKKVAFVWNAACQAAFEALKTSLTTSPILSMPADEGEYRLDTDASNVSIGAVLSQIQNGTERVIAYASRTLNGPEKNYCVTRKELLAVIFYARHFRPYLLGRPFVIRTDHSALSWLRRTPQPIGQQARWLEILEEFDYSIEHRPGRLHGNADAMSRRPCKQCQMDEEPEKFKAICPVVLGVPPSGDDSISPDAPESLAQKQRTDPELGPFYKIFAESSSRPSFDSLAGHSHSVKTLAMQWESMILKDSVLYRRFETAEGGLAHLQLIVPNTLQEDFLLRAHTGATGGHLGVRRTQVQVQRRGYWPGWMGSVARFCARCEQCCTYHRGKPKRQGFLQPMALGEPFERISIDITGPHPKSSAGHVFILTVVDAFTKWAEGFPIRNHEAHTVAQILVDQVFSRFGIPIQILSDRGTEFESNLMRELCVRLEVDKIKTTPYRPSTNGGVERFHRTLNSMMGKVVAENQRDWSARLPHVLTAYRASRHETTGFSPNFLMLGREARAPIDLIYGVPPETENTPISTVDFVENKLNQMRSAYDSVREETGKNCERAKRNYDLRVRPTPYSVGNWVFYFSPRRYQQRSPKWQRLYSGPYLIIRKINDVNVVIRKTAKSNPLVTHIDKLKLCLGDTPVNWLSEPVGGNPVEEHGAPPAAGRRGRKPPSRLVDETSGDEEEELERPRRQVVRPSHLADYV
jgi:predicted aspartyl protease